MATWHTLVSGSKAGNVSLNIDYAVENVSRSGNTVTFNYGIRFSMATSTWTQNAIAAFCPAGGTRYYAKKSGTQSSKGTYYYASSTSNSTTTSETVPFSYSKTVGVNDTSLSFEVGFGWDAYTPNQKDKESITVTFPAGFTYPWWTAYNIYSFPSTAYANIPYYYNIELGCNYGSSTSYNLLYWEGFYGNHGVVTVSTTAASIGAGTRVYTFSNSDIGTYNFRGVIRYSDGSVKYNVHGTTYPLTVSWLNPTLTGVTHRLNATNFYRTSTVQTTSGGTVTGNSASPSVYVYFSDTTDATGDSGAGYYKTGSYGPAAASAFNNTVKSYVHRGDRPGKFYTQLVMNGNNSAGTWSNFANVGYAEYTMQQFVTPTATRTIAYNKHNVYVGQTKFPLTINITAVDKSPYDNLTPTMKTYLYHNNSRQLDVNLTNSFAVGIYNQVLTNSYGNLAMGDTVSLISDLEYKDALNANATTSVQATNYVVKAIPQPSNSEISINVSSNEIKKTITAGVTGNFDSDFIGQYTLYLENANGTNIYAQVSGTISYDSYSEHTFTYDGSISENYKIRMVTNFALVDETTVKGTATTSYSNVIRVIGGTRIYIKYDGENFDKLYPIDSDECSKPRLAIKYGDTIKYVPLYTDTPQVGTKQLWVRKGGTNYYTLLNTQFGKLYPSDDLYPEGNELSYDDLTVFKHSFLANYTHQQIHNGDIE